MELTPELLGDRREAVIMKEDENRVTFALPPDYNIKTISDYASRPERVKQTVTLHDLVSFTGYVNRFKNPDSVLFFTPNVSKIATSLIIATAVIDYHQSPIDTTSDAEEPGARFGDHTVKLVASPSLAYRKLLELDGQLIPQAEFARKLDDIAKFSKTIPAGDLKEVARDLSLTSKGDFRNYEDDLSGSITFGYSLKVNASVNSGTSQRNLAVPSAIDFEVSILEGQEPVLVECDFRYAVPNGPDDSVKLGIRIKDREWLEKAAIQEVSQFAAEATGLLTLSGSYA